MACDIKELGVVGQQVDAQNRVGVLELTGKVKDCQDRDLNLTVTFAGQTFNTTVTADASPQAGDPLYHLFSTTINVGHAVRCDDVVTFRAECAQSPACFKTVSIPIYCKPGASPCPDQCVLTVTGPVPSNSPVSPADLCISPGTYRVTVTAPVGAGVTYLWQEQSGTSFSPQVSATSPHDVTVPAGSDPFQVLVIAMMPANSGCNPVAGSFPFPPRGTGPCPATATLAVKRNNVDVPPPHDALPPGAYVLAVTATPAVPGITYSFGEMGQAGTVPSTSNVFPLTLVAGSAPRTFYAIVDSGPCCPALPPMQVTLGVQPGTGTSPPPPPPPEPPPPEPPPPPPPPPEPPPTLPSICGLLQALIILLLLATVIMVDFAMCALPPNAGLLAAAGGTFAAALVVFALLASICGWTTCRIVGALAWACMWGFLFSIPIALGCLSITTFFTGVLFAIAAGLLVLWLNANRCPVPTPFQWP